MNTLNLTGFDSGDTSECASTSSTFSIQNSITRGVWSAYALQINPNTTGFGSIALGTYDASGKKNTSDPDITKCWARFYFRYGTKPASLSEVIACTGFSTTIGQDSLELRINSSGNLLVYSGQGADIPGVLQATGTTVLLANSWYRIEINDDESSFASCVWQVKIDGVSEASGSFGCSNGAATFLRLGKARNVNGNSVDFYYDDVLVSNSAYPGDSQVTLLLPNADGTYQTATIGAGSGSHYQIVDDIPPNSDTDYLITSGTATQAETEIISDISATTINCAKALCILKRDGASNGSIKQRRRSGITDSDLASAFASTAAYTICASLMDTDPATSSAWTVASINAVQVGVVEQSANTSRLTFVGLAVDYTPSSTPPTPPTTRASDGKSF